MRFALAGLLALAGCASSGNLDKAIGQPIQEAYVRWGPPAATFDMPDGATAHQWRKSRTVTEPIGVETRLKGNPYNPRLASQIYGGEVSTSECFLTMIARKDAAGVERIESYRVTGGC
jgi:hypothetical protein